MSDPDRTPLFSAFESDPDMRELVEQFVTELPDRRAELFEATRRGDLTTATRVAHQLKGASGGYGFAPLGEVAARTEDALRRLHVLSDRPAAEAMLRAAEPLLLACDRVRIASAA